MIRFADIKDADSLVRLHMDSIKRTYKGIYPDKHFLNMDYEVYYFESWILGNMTMNSHHRSLKALDFTDIFAIYT